MLRLLKWFFWLAPLYGRNKLLRWFAGIILLVVDISPLAILYETILDLIKWKTRPLNEKEKEILIPVFGDSINFNLISIDPCLIPVIRKKTIAYVSFHTINFHISISDATLVHEMVHIWQYEKSGAAYISEAIWAQRWGGGYNYGGLESLRIHLDGDRLNAFNFEQQADIIEDHFRLKNNLPLQWSINAPGAGDVFELYGESLKT